jgi:hypothetical protein
MFGSKRTARVESFELKLIPDWKIEKGNFEIYTGNSGDLYLSQKSSSYYTSHYISINDTTDLEQIILCCQEAISKINEAEAKVQRIKNMILQDNKNRND